MSSDRHFITGERRWLESLYRRYHRRSFVAPDPLQFLYTCDDPEDREIAALVAACLAYGNVKAMLPAIARVLGVLGPHPAAALHGTTNRALAARLRGFRYRFTTGAQMTALLIAARCVARRHGSLAACLASHARSDDATALPALGGLVDEFTGAAPRPLPHLLPHPRDGSACKRLNLLLRWMVRADGVDPGGWSGVRPDQLVIPLDTHVHRTALARGWTSRRTPNLQSAVEITDLLRRIRADDPLRYDFSVTRPGIRGESVK